MAVGWQWDGSGFGLGLALELELDGHGICNGICIWGGAGGGWRYLTPPSSIPQQTKVESGEPRATSGPGGEIFR